MEDNRPYVKVVMPGWWFYTQDPPPKWWVLLYWAVAVLTVLWPLWMLGLFAFAAIAWG
jgi:hypothetical protein